MSAKVPDIVFGSILDTLTQFQVDSETGVTGAKA